MTKKHGTQTVKPATDDQKIEIQYEFAKALKKLPFATAQKILKDKPSTRRFIQKNCKDLSIPISSENILTQIPLLERYYREVYGITLDLSEIMFPDNPELPAIMVDKLSQDEDEIMECIKNYFNKPKDPVNLYKYRDPVAKNIDRESEKLQLRELQSGLVVFAHTGSDEPDDKHRKKSYNDAVKEKLMFAKFREYLRMTGFHKFTKGYFLDRKGFTRTSSLWTDGYLVDSHWYDDYSKLCADNDNVGNSNPGSGPRQLFLSLT